MNPELEGMASGADQVETTQGEDQVNLFVASLRDTSGRQRAVGQALSGLLGPQIRASRKLRTKAKTLLSGLSAVHASRRKDARFVPAKASVAQVEAIHLAAMQGGLRRIAAQYPGQLKLGLLADELRELGLEAGRAGSVSVPVATLNKLLARRGVGGCDLLRARTLVDGMLSAEEQAQVAVSVLPSVDATVTPDKAREGTDQPHAPHTPHARVAAAEQLILESVTAKLKEQADSVGDDVGTRPDAPAVSQAIHGLELAGGPADVTAFHDFKVLQLAFQDVWTEVFDSELTGLGEALYQQAVQHYAEMDQTVPPLEAIEDIDTLKSFVDQIASETGIAPAATQEASPGTHGAAPAGSVELWKDMPFDVVQAFSDIITTQIWRILSATQQLIVQQQASIINPSAGPSAPEAARLAARQLVEYIVAHPAGSGGRLAQLMYELNRRLLERYAFEVFAPGSYNFGVLITYRQKWEPLSYQAGDLVASIPLAPGEVRRYSTRKVVKTTRAEKEIASSASSRSQDVTQAARAEAEIMRKTAQASNFSMSSAGTFNMEMVNITASNTFGVNQSQDSAEAKKDFREATLKAAEQFRKENSLEIGSTSSEELEEMNAGEISNPNNEITVTYLFYELQRRYQVSEQAHRAQAVILVAQDIPAPHEIDEAFLVANQWILSRFLLDESLRPALTYLTSGLAGDDVSLNVLRAHWTAQQKLLEKLEQAVTVQLGTRDALREALAQAVLGRAVSDAMNPSTTQQVASGILSGGVSLLFPGGAGNVGADVLEARRKATETRLKYVEEAVNELQGKLQSATEAYARATQDYADALGKTYARRVAIDQLRVHVKDNILHYMHGIWDSEPPDQRFFRLQDKKIWLPEPGASETVTASVTPEYGSSGQVNYGQPVTATGTFKYPPPTVGGPTATQVALVEIADLDKPLGYKGNYIIFPLRRPTYLTSFMLQEFVDSDYGIRDPDELGNWPLTEVVRAIRTLSKSATLSEASAARRQALMDRCAAMLTGARTRADEVIVPTGQLFVEALPGRHPLLEDFKLRHRQEDLRRAQAEVRHTQLENIRLAARLVAGEREDPDIDRRIMVDRALAGSSGAWQACQDKSPDPGREHKGAPEHD